MTTQVVGQVLIYTNTDYKLGLGTAWCGRYTVTVDIQVGSIPISLANLLKYMKITKIDTSHVTYVEVEDEGSYLRFGENSWLRQYGESWESCYFEEQELEKAYKEYTLDSIPK